MPGHFHVLHRFDSQAHAAEAEAGLRAPQAAVSPKFFYDELGSALFDAITLLPEYDLARNEAAILREQGEAILGQALALTGAAPTLIDLGAGSCTKAAGLFGRLKPARYVALDMAEAHLAAALARLQREHPRIAMHGVVLDLSQPWELSEALRGDGPALVFYPGSSIGNFGPDEALALLRRAHQLARGGALLIGVDLVKAEAQLQAAYDDALGVTAAFNLNLLRHLNRLIGGDFDLRQWRHEARYAARAARIEMHLLAREPLRVHWRGGASRAFAAGEGIHTENSHKWTLPRFTELLQAAGWRQPRAYTDANQRFALFLAGA